MFKKKSIKRLLIVFAVIFCLLLFLNIILETILKKSIATELELVSAESEYILGIKDLNVNIFKGNISISGLYAKPTDLLFSSFVEGKTKSDALKQIVVSQISLSGLEVFDFFIKKELIIDKIEVESLNYDFYRPEKAYQVSSIERDYVSTFSLDSIRIPGIDKIDLTAMQVANYGVHVIDASSLDTLSSYQGKELLFKGLSMNKNIGRKGYFVFDNSNLELLIKQQEFNLQGGRYAASFEELHYQLNTQEINMINFHLKPILSQVEFATLFNQVYDRNELLIENLTISGIDSYALFEFGIISIDHVSVDGLTADIFKDKTKPWNLDKKTVLPHTFLGNLSQPIHVNGLSIDNSKFYYSEKLPETNKLVQLAFENLKGEINYITTIRDSLLTKKSLDIKLSSDFLNVLPIALQINMPYLSDAFNVSGNTKQTTDFTHLNPVIYPALGMKFEDGILNGVNFNFTGNSDESKGALTMLYEDLEVEIYKENLSENKKASWVANAFMKKSNPNNNGRTVTADISFERLTYKGFGNYIWKSIQSGVVNSIMPFGKRRKVRQNSEEE